MRFHLMLRASILSLVHCNQGSQSFHCALNPQGSRRRLAPKPQAPVVSRKMTDMVLVGDRARDHPNGKKPVLCKEWHPFSSSQLPTYWLIDEPAVLLCRFANSSFNWSSHVNSQVRTQLWPSTNVSRPSWSTSSPPPGEC